MINIAILVPICSRNKNFKNIDEIPIMTCLYPSFLKTQNKEYNYSFFIGYDDDDNFYKNIEEELKHYFINVYMLSNCQHAPAHAWNKLAEIAYSSSTKYDYFFQIGDDIILQSYNWSSIFIERLILHNNIGVVGPCNLVNYNGRKALGKPYVIENAFVSRKHLDIFGYFFHPSIKNWYCDDWITQVYMPYFSEMQTDILCSNTICDTYKVEYCTNIETLISESRTMIKHKKIFSYCIYGSYDKYCLGMIKNIEQIRKYFPDFEIWITIGNDIPINFIEQYKSYKNVCLIYTNFSSGRLTTYRFFPIDDPTIDIMIVRDADSRFSELDIWCINNFIESSFKIFTIRNHIYHLREMMAGLCGIKNFKGINLKENYNQYIKDKDNISNIDSYQNDQDFIIRYLYYPYKKFTIAYTSHKIYPHENIYTIPSRDIDFCGNVYEFDDNKNEYVVFNSQGKII